jgi:hypothetical protein
MKFKDMAASCAVDSRLGLSTSQATFPKRSLHNSAPAQSRVTMSLSAYVAGRQRNVTAGKF